MPDFPSYHKSVTSELDAVKHRIRNLVTNWLEDGEWKEAALKTVLRRHLPGSALVGRGFIVGPDHSSTQINILDAVCQVYQETEIAINCVTCGYDLFVRYWPPGEYEPGDDPAVDKTRKYWRAYKLDRLSPSYFIGNLVDAICDVDRNETAYAWFAYQDGKRQHRLAEKRGEECEP